MPDPELSAELAATVGYKALYVLGGIVLVVLITWLSPRLARLIMPLTRLGPHRVRPDAQRHETLVRLYSSLISALAIIGMLVFILRLFVDPSQIIWIIGLFSAAFGMAARGLVSDLLAGGGFISRNTFAIGEKVEFLVAGNKVEGIVEDVNMRATLVRATTGEIFTIPNGDIGIIRNFSRGRFSGAKWAVTVPTTQLAEAVEALNLLSHEATVRFPALLDPWTVLLSDGEIGQETTLNLVARFHYGQAAVQRPLVAAFIYDGLTAAGIRMAAHPFAGVDALSASADGAP